MAQGGSFFLLLLLLKNNINDSGIVFKNTIRGLNNLDSLNRKEKEGPYIAAIHLH